MTVVRELSDAGASDFPEAWHEITDDGHFLPEWRFRAFLGQLESLCVPTDEPWRGLDVGSGRGVLRQQLERRTAWIVDGADLDRNALAHSRAGRGEALVYDVRDRSPALRERYDVVLLFDVLEHIEDVPRFLAAVLYHLKPAGWLFVNVPALPRLAGTFDRVVGHRRRYTRRTLRAAAGGLPLAVRELRYWGFCMLPYLLIRKLTAPPEDAVRRVLERGLLPPAAWMNRWIFAIMNCEIACLKRPPLGVSLLMAGIKVTELSAD
jgi:SAM-dependent methyltransferase